MDMTNVIKALNYAALEASVKKVPYLVTVESLDAGPEGPFQVHPAAEGEPGIHVAPNGDTTCQGQYLGKAIKIIRAAKE